MRFYETMEEAYSEIKRDVKEMSICYNSETVQDQKGEFVTRELMNYGYTITTPGAKEAANTAVANGINADWLRMEAKERIDLNLSRKNPNPAYRENLEFWKQFLRDGCFSYSYPERLHPQLARVIHELRVRPYTRHGILTVYDWHQDLMNAGGRDRIPCSMYYQFMIREGKLHLSYTMRSCDIIKFFLADAAIAIAMLHDIAYLLGTGVGTFTHFIGSLHAFDSDLKGVF